MQKLDELILQAPNDMFLLDACVDPGFRNSFNTFVQTGYDKYDMIGKLREWRNFFEYKNLFTISEVGQEIAKLSDCFEIKLKESRGKKGKHKNRQPVDKKQREVIVQARDMLRHIFKKIRKKDLSKYINLNLNKYTEILMFFDRLLNLKTNHDKRDSELYTDEKLVSAAVCLSESGENSRIISKDKDISTLLKAGFGILCAPQFSPKNEYLFNALRQRPVIVYFPVKGVYKPVTKGVDYTWDVERVLENLFKKDMTKKISVQETERLINRVHAFYKNQYL